MEIRYSDLAGRIGKLKVNGKRVETPILLPVINPKKQTVPMDKIKEIGVDGVITNSYIIWKNENLRRQALERGVHKLIDFDGLVMTDSGAFQLMQYGHLEVGNREIVKFQKDIGVDIGVILDIPGLGSREQMKENVKITIDRARKVQDIIQASDTLWAAPIQGGVYRDLRRYSARKMKELGFRYFAVGSVVPLLNDYRFSEAFDALVWTRQVVPWDTPVHFFGAGHPMMFAFGVALGADVFDSAAYALFAEKGKYLTEDGTRDINTMKELPCSCPVCSTHTVDDLKKDKSLLALHNLYVTLEEMKRVKEAVRQGTLWELLEKRARAHPKLYDAFTHMKEYIRYIEEKDRISKKRFFVLSHETKNRPEVYRHKLKVMSGIQSKQFVNIGPFKEVPKEVLQLYPFGQIEGVARPPERCENDYEIVRGIFGYIYGYYDIIPKNASIEKSKNTGRIRNVSLGDRLLFVLRASDYYPILHGIAWEMLERDGWKVVVNNNSSDMVKDGKSVFCKFVLDADPRIRAGMEVLVVNENGELLATGTARMSGSDMVESRDGVAVDTRKLNPKYAPK